MKKFLTVLIAIWKACCWFAERANEKKKRKKEGRNVAEEGLKERDPSKITAGFNDINNA